MGSTAEFLAMKLGSLLPCLLLGASRVKGQTVCCPLLVVTNLGDLDDTYTLSEDRGDKPEDICNDGCVYTRGTPDSPDDEYCFKSEVTEGESQCQDTTDLKANLEAEVADLESEVADLEADEAAANDLNTALDEADAKVEELTSESTTPAGSRVRRQEQPPQTCDEIADIIEQLADEEKTNAERLALVQLILATPIKKCTPKDKLTKTKIKIKKVKTETGERIKIIIKIKDRKTKEIEKKKLVIKIIDKHVEENSGKTNKPPEPTGEGPMSMNPEGVTGDPTGQEPITMDPTGQEPINMESTGKPTGQQPVEMGGTGEPTGQQPVEMGGTGKPTGQQPVEMEGTGKPTGQQAVEINITGKPTGQQAVEIGATGKPTGQIAVEIDPTGQQAVEIKPTEQPV